MFSSKVLPRFFQGSSKVRGTHVVLLNGDVILQPYGLVRRPVVYTCSCNLRVPYPHPHHVIYYKWNSLMKAE